MTLTIIELLDEKHDDRYAAVRWVARVVLEQTPGACRRQPAVALLDGLPPTPGLEPALKAYI